jgi:ABC-2 type transport system ATP-binding protein
MEEAEVCDRIAIIDKGKIIAMGSPEELKRTIGGDVVYMRTTDNANVKEEIERLLKLTVTEKDGELYMTCDMGDTCIPEMMRKIGEKVVSVRLQRPTLNDVFLKLTGKAIREEEASSGEGVKEYVRAYRRRTEK